MAPYSVHAWLANPRKNPLSGIPVDRKRWPRSFYLNQHVSVHVKACKLAAWGQDLFVHVWFSRTFRRSDREQILNMNSQIDGFGVIRGTGVSSGEASQ